MEVRTAQGTMEVTKIPNAPAFEVVIKDSNGNIIRVDRVQQVNMQAVANAILESINQGASNAELNQLAGTPPVRESPPKLIAKPRQGPVNPRTGKRGRQ
jgi:hypothetical protein